MLENILSASVFRGLTFRVLFFLSLALLPIGLIAIIQTQQISKEMQNNAELSLLAVAEQAAFAETEILRNAFDAAETLGPVVKSKRYNLTECSTILRDYKEASGIYALVAFIEAGGMMNCSSSDRAFDFSDNPVYVKVKESGLRYATSRSSGQISERPVALISVPFITDDTFSGMVSISIPYATFDSLPKPALARKPLAVMTFNQEGQILTSNKSLEINDGEVPKDLALSIFVGNQSQVFRAPNTNGVARAYAIHPVIPNVAYAISVWPEDTPFLKTAFTARAAAFLPIVMWAATLLVAFWALNRLAIRHIRNLGADMRLFARNRTLPSTTLDQSIPTELVEMESAFVDMGQSILRDEAKLEGSLQEKNILLKEVHHRVKNNMQLISSIMNMQIRQAKDNDVRLELQRLQDRILGLATVHKNLYQNDNIERVDAKLLVEEIAGQLLSAGLAAGSNVTITQNYESILLEADDAAPLTLLVSEAVTNALKYMPDDPEIEKMMAITLVSKTPQEAEFTIINTTGGKPIEEGTGLGSKLIDAFARQLNGQVKISETDDFFTLRLSFPLPSRTKRVIDF